MIRYDLCKRCDTIDECVCETCEFCGELSATPMCDHCAEADEAGVLDKYLAGEVPCPACAKM